MKMQKEESFVAPTKLFMAITNACNVKCLHCMPDSRCKMPNEMSAMDITKVIDDAGKMEVPRIAFTGGEPTLDKNLESYIEKAASHNMRVDIETSASLYRPGQIIRLKEKGLKVLCLSLDGPTAEYHDKFRGVPGLFEKVLAAAKEGTAAGLDVRVYCAVSAQNIDVALDVADLFNAFEHPIVGLTFAPVTPIGRATRNSYLTVSRDRWIEFHAQFEEKRNFIRNKFKMRMERMFIRPEELNEFSKVFPHDFSCIARERRYMYINPVGDMYGCSLLTGSDKKLGNARDEGISAVWKHSQGWSFFGEKATQENIKQKCCEGCPALKLRSVAIKGNNFEHVGNEQYITICPMVQTPQIDVWPEAISG